MLNGYRREETKRRKLDGDVAGMVIDRGLKLALP